MKRGYRRGSLLFAGLLFAFQTHIMAGNHVVAAVDSTRTAVADTVKKAGKKIPAIAEFIKPGAQSFPGMFTVYAQDDRYYVEVPDALLGRDIFVMVSLVQGSAQQTRGERDMLGYAGDALFSRLVRFERGPKDKLFLKEPVYTTVMPDPSSDLYGAVSASGMMPIAVGFDVKARGEHSVLVDFTDTYTSDHQYFSLKGAKEMMNIGSYQSDRSYPTTVSAFRDNVIFRSVKSYSPGKAPETKPGAPKAGVNATIWEVASSWCLLPEKPMRPRYYDPRVGYFVNGVTDYTYDPIKSETLLMVSRWRVEPRPADMERHRRGELVEPAKPIVFYVDRNTPEYLRPYVIAGIEEWQTAFEKIGFKNAIIGRMAPTPEEDPDFSIEDARYSCVSYKASPIPNAYGPHIADPRTGEILCSHVGLFHNVLALAQTWYFTQCAPVDPAARKLPLDKELMGKLMQYITAHEIGHTLGLRHNFAGSWTFSVEEIRDRDFVKNNSHGATIMDYMRFNYVAQPEDRIAPGDLIPKQGDYDRFAIAWGYQYLPQFKSAKEERAYLSQWTTGQRKANHRVFFGTESDPEDPRFQSEDLGDNAMQADALGIKNLKVLTANLVAWTAGDDEDYSRLTAQFRDARTQYLKYISHVTRYIGGRYNDASIRSEQMQGYVPVPRALQQEAMDFLLEHFFAEPVWLVEGRHADLTRFDRENFARGVMRQVYPMLLARSMTLIKHEALAGDKAYTFRDMDNALYADAFASLEGRAAIPLFDRIKQSEYVRSAMDVLKAIPAEKRAPELGMQVVSRLEPLADLCRQRAEQTTDTLTKNHLMGLSDAIMVWLGQDKRELLSAK